MCSLSIPILCLSLILTLSQYSLHNQTHHGPSLPPIISSTFLGTTHHRLHLSFFLVILHRHHRLIHRFLVLFFSPLLPGGFINLRVFNQPRQIDKFHKDSSHFLLPMLRYVSKKTIPLKPITIPKPSHHSNSNAAKKLAF